MSWYHTICNLGLTIMLMFNSSSADCRSNHAPVSPSNTAEMELLIVCDKEFSDRFQNDCQKMIDYWAVYMWDVHLRFQTLHGVHITFRVTSLTTIHNAENQPFIENARERNGKLLISLVYEEFGKWVRNHESDFPGFDVALLVTRTELNDSESHLTSFQTRNSACTKPPSFLDEFSNVIILHSSSTWGNACSTLAASLATFLGADYDENTRCTNNQFLMNNGHCGNNQYYFSKCSGAEIARFLKERKSSCLRFANAPGIDILKSAKATHPPSMTDQCKMVTGHLNAAVSNEEASQCIRSNCTLNIEGAVTFEKYLFPLDNSPCGDKPNTFCFRGRCLHQGPLLQYVGYKKCFKLIGKMTFVGPAFYAGIVDCIESPTPQGLIRIDYDEKHGSRIVAHVFSETDQETYEICLCTREHTPSFLEFNICAEVEDYKLRWDAVKFEGTNEFALWHRHHKLCLHTNDDDQFELAPSMRNESNWKYRWVFLENHDVVMMKWNAISNNSNFVTRVTSVFIVIWYVMLIIV